MTTTNTIPATNAHPADASGITVARDADRPRMIETIVAAFAMDPVATSLLGPQYAAFFPKIAGIFAAGAISHGAAYIAAGGRAAALWYPPGTGPDGQALAEALEQGLGREGFEAVMGLLEEMDRNHPAEPHFYLPMIAVEPAYQRRGIGSALLRSMLERLDREGQVAYLESSNPANHEMYRRHGFEPRSTIQVGRVAPLLTMVRRPR